MSDTSNAMKIVLDGSYAHKASIQRRLDFLDYVLARVSKKRFLYPVLIHELWLHLVNPEEGSGIVVLEEERDMVLGMLHAYSILTILQSGYRS